MRTITIGNYGRNLVMKDVFDGFDHVVVVVVVGGGGDGFGFVLGEFVRGGEEAVEDIFGGCGGERGGRGEGEGEGALEKD